MEKSFHLEESFRKLTLFRAPTSEPKSMSLSRRDVRLSFTAYMRGVIPVAWKQNAFLLVCSIKLDRNIFRIRIRKYEIRTRSATPARGTVLASSPAAAMDLSKDLRTWSTGAHSPFWQRVRIRWAASRTLAPALWGLELGVSSPSGLLVVSSLSFSLLSLAAEKKREFNKIKIRIY